MDAAEAGTYRRAPVSADKNAILKKLRAHCELERGSEYLPRAACLGKRGGAGFDCGFTAVGMNARKSSTTSTAVHFGLFTSIAALHAAEGKLEKALP